MGEISSTMTDDELEAQIPRPPTGPTNDEMEALIQAEIDANPKPATGPIDMPARIKLQNENRFLKELLASVLELALPRNIYGGIINRTRCIRCENSQHPGCSCICHLVMEMIDA